MALFALGFNHQNATIAQREKLSFATEQLPDVIKSLSANQAIEEVVVLSTCHRMELYTVTKCHNAVKEWLRRTQRHGDVVHNWYELHDINMVRHLMAVASGLNSMVLGEPQILGQMKQAYQLAFHHGTVGKQFQHLFPAVFSAAKQVRTDTNIGASPVTMVYAAVQLAKSLFSRLTECNVMLIGAGETIELAASYLHQQQVGKIIVANRTFERAHDLARSVDGIPIGLNEIEAFLPEADLIISATSSRSPILSSDMLQQACRVRGERALFIADLAVPRDVEPTSAALNHVHLYNIDDLQDIIAQNQKNRVEEVKQAEAIIELRASHYLRQLRVQNTSDMIQKLRTQVEQMRDQELQAALKKIQNNVDPKTVMEEFARRLANKLMHHPTVKLRDAAYAQHSAMLNLLKELYEL